MRTTAEEPDVLLDVSELEVDRINLEVEDLRAHVSVLAELANLVSLSVGVGARLDRVKLEIEGVEAEVLLACHTDVTLDRREADAEGSRHLALAHASFNGLDDPLTQVFGVSFILP